MPHFAERDEKTNAFRQQDAHECWSAIISTLAQTLKVGSPQAEEVHALSFPLSLSLSLSLSFTHSHTLIC